MSTIIKHIILVIFLLFMLSCDDPAPIEIITVEEEEVEIGVINTEPNFVVTGYDSTGITNITPENESVITLSRIKNTINNITYYRGYGEAIFYDITKPIIISDNRKIGFKTLDFGTVKFGNRKTNRVPHYLKYRVNNNDIKDTLIGIKHIISYNTGQLLSQLNFPNEKDLEIEFINREGNSSLLTIKLPTEIRGNIKVSGSRRTHNLKIILTWNKLQMDMGVNNGKVSEEIIVGGILKNSDKLVPLFWLKRFMRPRLTIPNSLIEDVISSDNYEYIVFTFIRKIRKSNSISRLGDVYFASQSIHNIWIDI